MIEPFFYKTETVQTRGRPRREDRGVMNGVLWILRSGARWCEIRPADFRCRPAIGDSRNAIKTVTLKRVIEALAEDLHSRGGLDLSECFIDGTFVVAKKGAAKLGRQAGQMYEAHGSSRPH